MTTFIKTPPPTPEQALDNLRRRIKKREEVTAHIRAYLPKRDPEERLTYLEGLLRTRNAELRKVAYEAAVESNDEAMRAFALEHKDAFLESDYEREKEIERKKQELELRRIDLKEDTEELFRQLEQKYGRHSSTRTNSYFTLGEATKERLTQRIKNVITKRKDEQ